MMEDVESRFPPLSPLPFPRMKPFFKGSFKAICVPLSSTVGHLTCPTLQLDTEPFERQGEASVTGMSEIQGPVASAQRLVWAANQALGNAALGALFA